MANDMNAVNESNPYDPPNNGHRIELRRPRRLVRQTLGRIWGVLLGIDFAIAILIVQIHTFPYGKPDRLLVTIVLPVFVGMVHCFAAWQIENHRYPRGWLISQTLNMFAWGAVFLLLDWTSYWIPGVPRQTSFDAYDWGRYAVIASILCGMISIGFLIKRRILGEIARQPL